MGVTENMAIKLKYVVSQRLPSGNMRYRFRRKGVLNTLPNDPESPEFMEMYCFYRFGTPIKATPASPIEGSLSWLISDFVRAMQKQVDTGLLSIMTLKQRRNLLGNLATSTLDGTPRGERTAFGMQPEHVRAILTEMSATPASANNLLKSLRAMYRWACEVHDIDFNPTDGVRKVKYQTNGYTPWTVDDLRTFVKTHPIGSQAHLTLMLLVFTNCRRGDLVKLGKQHRKTIGGIDSITFTQAKGNNSETVRVTLPIMPPLAKALDSAAAGDFIYLLSAHGKPFIAESFGNKFRTWADEAGLPDLSMHGIRKGQGAILAEYGCTPHEIMAILGHTNITTGEIYTRSANRISLAKSGMEKLSTWSI